MTRSARFVRLPAFVALEALFFVWPPLQRPQTGLAARVRIPAASHRTPADVHLV